MLASKFYVPLLKTKVAEIEAFRQLSSEARDRVFPIFLLRPWPNANHLSLSIERIREAVEGHPFGLGLDWDRRHSSSQKPAQAEFNELFDDSVGFRNYYEFLQEIEYAVPVVQPTNDASRLLQQFGNATDLDRGLIVHHRRGSGIPISETVLSSLPVPNDTIFVVDAGWSRDGLQMQAWVEPVVGRINGVIPDAEIVVMCSSFPDSFASIIGSDEKEAHERGIFGAVRQRYQQANLTLGDWASTRLPQTGGGGVIPSRVDIPLTTSWRIFRADPDNDLGYPAIAQAAAQHPCFGMVPDCWGKLQVQSTDGNGTGITGTKMNTSARINMHMTIQSGATETLDSDEQPYVD